MTQVFDTLRLAQALHDQVKFPAAQAEATAQALADSFGKAAPVTTRDLDLRLHDLEQRMTIRLGGMMMVVVGIILTALRYFSGGH